MLALVTEFILNCTPSKHKSSRRPHYALQTPSLRPPVALIVRSLALMVIELVPYHSERAAQLVFQWRGTRFDLI